MSYLQNIVSRHISTENHVTPRSVGRFETPFISTNPESGFSEQQEYSVMSANNKNENTDFLAGLFSREDGNTNNFSIKKSGYTEEPIEADLEQDFSERESKPLSRPENPVAGMLKCGKKEMYTLNKDENYEFNDIPKKTSFDNPYKRDEKEGDFVPVKNFEFNQPETLSKSGNLSVYPGMSQTTRDPEPVMPVFSETREKESRLIPGEAASFNEKPCMSDFRRMFQNQKQVDKDSHPQPGNVIRVEIGRIDIRAVHQTIPIKSPAQAKPAMSLSDFLKKKNGNS